MFTYKILCRISTREKQLKDIENGTTMIRSFFFPGWTNENFYCTNMDKGILFVFSIYKDLHLLVQSRKDLSTCHETKVENKNHFLPQYQRNVYSTANKFPFPPTCRIIYYFSEEVFWKEPTTLASQWYGDKRFWFSRFWYPTSVAGRCRINAKMTDRPWWNRYSPDFIISSYRRSILELLQRSIGSSREDATSLSYLEFPVLFSRFQRWELFFGIFWDVFGGSA